MKLEDRASRATRRSLSTVARMILGIGLFAGALDITDNLIFNQIRGITPKMVFQYIASGVLGMKSFQGGLATVALGIVLHFVIALIWTGVFYAASCKFAILLRRPVMSGLLYGGAVYLLMNFIVLPLSAVPHRANAITMASRINGVLAVVLFIGVTISLLVRRQSAGTVETRDRVAADARTG